MRDQFTKSMIELMRKDKKIYFLNGDVGGFIFEKIKKEFPQRCINIGICEQTMIGLAAGMALEGLKPYVYAITPFLIERPFEQIKLDIDQQNVNVKLVGYADYPTQGPTHSELNGEKLMGLLKNISNYFPKTEKDVENAIRESYNSKKPTFISLKNVRRYEKNGQCNS